MTLRFKREWRDLNADADCHDAGEISGVLRRRRRQGRGRRLGTADDPHAPCPGDIVLYNSCATGDDYCLGFPDALYKNAGEGFPIIEIDSVGTFLGRAGSYRQIAMDVARNKIDIQVEGAITARGPVTAAAAATPTGTAGTWREPPDGACADQPAVTVDARPRRRRARRPTTPPTRRAATRRGSSARPAAPRCSTRRRRASDPSRRRPGG